MGPLLTDIGSFFTAFMAWAVSIGNAVLNSPLLLISFAIGVCGVAIGFFRRLLRAGR